MRNVDRYRETKYVWHAGRLRGSRNEEHLSASSRVFVDELAGHYARHAAVHCHGSLVDLGCGSVPLYTLYRRYVTEVTCVDWAGSRHGTEFVDQQCDLAGELPFAAASFDTLLLSDVLEHVEAPAHLWGEMARILRPGGKLLWNVPFLYWLHEEPFDYFRYTEFALKKFAERAGFEVLVLEPVGGAVEVLADIASKSLLGLPVGGTRLAGAVQGTVGLWRRTKWGQRAASVTRHKFPLGYFGVARRLEESSAAGSLDLRARAGLTDS